MRLFRDRELLMDLFDVDILANDQRGFDSRSGARTRVEFLPKLCDLSLRLYRKLAIRC